jgi:hypothetical protein
MEEAPHSEGSEPRESHDRPRDDGLLRTAPFVARVAAGAWLRGAEWTIDSSRRAMTRLSRAATSGESPADLLRDARRELREQARRILGVTDLEQRLRPDRRADGGGKPLREQGADLLFRSADVDAKEETHPAYERILSQLTPDEARVLRLLATAGPRPAIDVRTWRPLGIGDELVAPGLTMISAEAGCRHPDQMPAYLNNLYRLGLVWFSREPVEDLRGYQVLEAQPDAQEAMARAGRARSVRRSIGLTPFGADFCETCLPLETSEFEAAGIRDPVAEEPGTAPDV